jgi:hypothetical protein
LTDALGWWFSLTKTEPVSNADGNRLCKLFAGSLRKKHFKLNDRYAVYFLAMGTVQWKID